MIAIHFKKGYFSERWVEFCKKNNVKFKIVNVYDSDIIEQLSDCKAFMWHFDHMNYTDSLFAKQLMLSLENSSIKIFPDVNTCWHFNDKIGQKYLLESVEAPLVKSYVFYDKNTALNWAGKTKYPKVFKLRGGAGSLNVKLVKNKHQANNLIKKAFGKGYAQFNSYTVFKERYRKFRLGKANFLSVLKWFLAIFLGTWITKLYNREKGYVYFQDFIPDNHFDIRVVVIGKKAFAIKRLVRANDFRASGSGFLIYKKEEIPIECIKTAFETHKKLKAQALSYDFVLVSNERPLLVEISFGYSMEAYDICEGYWDETLEWHPGFFHHEYWMVELMLSK